MEKVAQVGWNDGEARGICLELAPHDQQVIAFNKELCPLVRGQGQLRREALRLHQRLIVDHDELALVRPAVPLQEDPGALVAQQPQLRAAVGGRARVMHEGMQGIRPKPRSRPRMEDYDSLRHGVTQTVGDLGDIPVDDIPPLEGLLRKTW